MCTVGAKSILLLFLGCDTEILLLHSFSLLAFLKPAIYVSQSQAISIKPLTVSYRNYWSDLNGMFSRVNLISYLCPDIPWLFYAFSYSCVPTLNLFFFSPFFLSLFL